MARSFSQGAYNDQDRIEGMVQPTGRALVRSLLPWPCMSLYSKLLVERRAREVTAELAGSWGMTGKRKESTGKRKSSTATRKSDVNPMRQKKRQKKSCH